MSCGLSLFFLNCILTYWTQAEPLVVNWSYYFLLFNWVCLLGTLSISKEHKWFMLWFWAKFDENVICSYEVKTWKHNWPRVHSYENVICPFKWMLKLLNFVKRKFMIYLWKSWLEIVSPPRLVLLYIYIYISALCNPLGLFSYCVHRSNNCKWARMARKYSSTEKT